VILPVQSDLFAVIGNPVSHSLSPAMMNALFKFLNIPAVYLALQVDALEDDLVTLTKMGFQGLSVTIPHKETAYSLVEEMDETARIIGAVNTLKRRGDRWEARNTDWVGSNRALLHVAPLKARRAVVLGAGGAARAVVFGLKREGAQVSVSNRSIDRGEALAKAFDCEFLPLDELERTASAENFDVVVQCTSVGLAGTKASAIVSDSFFHPGMVVMDTVYRPLWTPFLLSAKEAGCVVITGIEMLLHQGVAQLEWWLDRFVPSSGIDVMRNALERALAHGKNG
jgi:shikimate dehydrogenase